MGKYAAISQMQKRERFCTLAEAIDDPFLEDFLHLWVVDGQYLFKNVPQTSYSINMTFVGRNAVEPDKFSVGAIISGKHYFKGFDYTKNELKQNFPELFRMIGQLKSLRSR